MIAGTEGLQPDPSLAMAHRLEQVLTGDLTWYRGKVLPHQCGAVNLRALDLADPPTLACVIDRFASRHPNADRRAVGSHWSQLYCAFVIPP